MERRTAARWLIVFAFACFGWIVSAQAASAEQTVQGTQSSTDSTAETGSAEGDNSVSFNAGPSANGSTGANSQQLGQNNVSVSQSGSVESGDPVAGAQVTGVVADNATVQNQNSAENPQAVSGDATLENEVEAFVGPSATTDSGTAQAGQIGSNEVDISQSGNGSTGDAVAGGQVTGIVGGGEHIVQNQNNASCGESVEDSCAETGEVEVQNEIDELTVGPFAETDGEGDGAQVAQVGDNDAVITQSATGASGDAVYGSQVTGVVGGSATVQGQNTSDCDNDPCAESGDAEIENEIDDVTVGPVAIADGNTMATQNGSNLLDAVQETVADTGDALSGSQVVGAVGDGDGFLVVQNQQASEDDSAESGDVETSNNIDDFDAGPSSDSANGTSQASQFGDNDVAIAQNVEAGTGDALAGAQVTGAVNFEDVTVQNQNSADSPFAESGEVTDTDQDMNDVDDLDVGPDANGLASAQAEQIGDNAVSVSQSIDAATGDAIAGGQVTGVVASGSTVTIQNQNTVTGTAEAISGDVDDLENEFDNNDIGPEAQAEDSAQAQQTGDNSLALSQSIEAQTGDAVAGAQVAGVVAGANATITVQQQNSCTGEVCAIATSGDALDLDNDAGDDANNVGPAAEAFFLGGTASAQQNGDNAVSADQSIEAGTGDAVAGAQVTGVVAGAGSDVEIQNQNTAEGAEATSGDVDDAENELEVNIGPAAESDGDAQAQQTGDNSLVFAQDIDVASGDAVAGAQVTGVVGPDDAIVQVQNDDDGSTANSGDAIGTNDASGSLTAFADSFGGNATAQQNGDSGFEGSQTLATATGDALAGAQVSGDVGAASSTEPEVIALSG